MSPPFYLFPETESHWITKLPVNDGMDYQSVIYSSLKLESSKGNKTKIINCYISC